MALPQTIDALIEKDPKLRGGRPIITGTGTTVRAIAGYYKLGFCAEEIATQLPHLNLAQVYAALTYYHLHLDEIEADISADSEENLQRLRTLPPCRYIRQRRPPSIRKNEFVAD